MDSVPGTGGGLSGDPGDRPVGRAPVLCTSASPGTWSCEVCASCVNGTRPAPWSTGLLQACCPPPGLSHSHAVESCLFLLACGFPLLSGRQAVVGIRKRTPVFQGVGRGGWGRVRGLRGRGRAGRVGARLAEPRSLLGAGVCRWSPALQGAPPLLTVPSSTGGRRAQGPRLPPFTLRAASSARWGSAAAHSETFTFVNKRRFAKSSRGAVLCAPRAGCSAGWRALSWRLSPWAQPGCPAPSETAAVDGEAWAWLRPGPKDSTRSALGGPQCPSPVLTCCRGAGCVEVTVTLTGAALQVSGRHW